MYSSYEIGPVTEELGEGSENERALVYGMVSSSGVSWVLVKSGLSRGMHDLNLVLNVSNETGPLGVDMVLRAVTVRLSGVVEL